MIGRIYEADDRRAAVRALHGQALRQLIREAHRALRGNDSRIAQVVLDIAGKELQHRIMVSLEMSMAVGKRRLVAEDEYLNVLRYDDTTWHMRRNQMED